MAEDVKDSVDDLDLSDFNFDDLPETDVDIDLNLDETNSADLNFDDILAKENKTSADKITEHQGSNLSFDDLGSGGIFEKDNEEISWDAPVAEDVPTVTEKEPEVSPFGVDVDGESAVAEDFTPEPFGGWAEGGAGEESISGGAP